MNAPNKGIRYNVKKPRLSLTPPIAQIEAAKVLTFGATKYSPWNWRKGLSFMEIVDSLERHLAAWKMGEDTDADSKLTHVGHIVCNAMFLAEMALTRPDLDDRPVAEYAAIRAALASRCGMPQNAAEEPADAAECARPTMTAVVDFPPPDDDAPTEDIIMPQELLADDPAPTPPAPRAPLSLPSAHVRRGEHGVGYCLRCGQAGQYDQSFISAHNPCFDRSEELQWRAGSKEAQE